MANGRNPALYWAPRALCILLIGFVSMFALDVFSERLRFWETLVHLAMHLIPSFVMILLLVCAWRWEWVGTAAFFTIGVFFAITVRGTWWVKSIFAVPSFLIAGLFLLNWLKKLHPTPH